MSNTITIELCAEDRARLDRLSAALEQRVTQEAGITLEIADPLHKQLAEALANTEPQETPKEEPKVETTPTEETPTQSTQEPESDAPAEKVEPSVTLEQIQQKVVQLAAAGADKKAKAREVISTYGTKVSDLKDKPEKWDEVWEKLAALEG